MKTRFLALASALVLVPGLAFAQSGAFTIDPMHSQAGFEIRHLGVSNVRGTISKISGTIVLDPKDAAKDSVVADLDTTTIDTTVTPRDNHLKSDAFFNVAKYPTIHFQSTSVKKEGGKLKIYGNLTLAGVTKPVVLDAEGPSGPIADKNRGSVVGFSATTLLHRADFNFGPSFAPPMIGDEVKITLDLEAGQK